MTHHPLRRTEPDGTRVYENYHRYTPKQEWDRGQRRKPDDPRAFRWYGKWYWPLADILIPDEDRVMPDTSDPDLPRPVKKVVVDDG